MYFIISVATLIIGYMVYSRVVERFFGADNCKATPACTMADGVDYVKMSPGKIFLIQLLNIAGLGPVFGPILGALYGPWALVWIVLVGYNLGNGFKQFMRFFSVVLLLLVGVVFVTGPAALLASMTDWTLLVWVVIIFAYYFLATILPVDKIIGRIYPLFAVILLIMAVGLTAMLFIKGFDFYPAAQWTNQHPKGLPLWPLMFITIACGAISGFHATQSPMMARCVPDENCGRPIFYGAMIAEGVIALIWATLGMTFYDTPDALNATLAAGGPGKVVKDVSIALMGPVGGILAILGVVVLPITSGDTAFRSARLTIADFLNFSQVEQVKRLVIAVPLFVVGAILSQMNFDIIWRYFGWANQTLATIVLWAAAAYLVRRGMFHWIASVPATFMTSVCTTYLCYAKIGLGMPLNVSTWIGLAVAAGSLILFLAKRKTFEASPA